MFAACARMFLASLVIALSGAGCAQRTASPAAPEVRAGASGARFVVTIPSRATATARRTSYVPSRAQSIYIGVTPGSTVFEASLTGSNASCSTTAAGRVCTLNVPAPAGSDTFSVKLYDGALDGSGHVTGALLAAANSFGATVVADAPNTTIPLVLGGVPTSVRLSWLSDPYPVTSQPGGFAFFGTSAQTLVVQAIDADNNVIVGQGAPALSLTSPSSNITIAAVSGTAGNFTVTPGATIPDTSIVLTATATPSGTGTATLSTTAPLALANKALYATSAGQGVHVYYDGHTTADATIAGTSTQAVTTDTSARIYTTSSPPNTISAYTAGATTPYATVAAGTTPLGIAVSPAGVVYVANYGDSTVGVYATLTSTPTTFPVTNARGVCLDSSGNIYAGGYQSSVQRYTPGTYVATLTYPNPSTFSCTVDRSDTLYITNSDNNTVTLYPFGSTTSSFTIAPSNPGGTAVEPSGFVWTTSVSGNNVYGFSAGNNSAPNVTIVGNTSPNSLAVYPR